MAPIWIACIVEGHGEVKAVPVLIHRIARAVDPTILIQVPEPIRVQKDKLSNPVELSRAIELAYRKIRGEGAVLVLLDSDDDCPATRGPDLLRRACAARPGVPISVVLAHREFETWFLAAAESLRGFRNLPEDLQTPTAPETIRGAKEWLSSHLPPRMRYSETLDQPELTRRFDLKAARRAGSFDKCYREIAGIIATLRKTG